MLGAWPKACSPETSILDPLKLGPRFAAPAPYLWVRLASVTGTAVAVDGTKLLYISGRSGDRLDALSFHWEEC